MKKECFDSIDNLPIWNWWQITETGNLVYLRKDDDYTSITIEGQEVWLKIQNEYLNEFGRTEKLRRIVKLKQTWNEHATDLIVNGNKFAKTLLKIVEADLESEIETNESPKENTLIFLEEKLGRELDPKTVSVRKYNNYINYYSRG